MRRSLKPEAMNDDNRLQALAIFHYIIGGMVAMFTVVVLLPFVVLAYPCVLVYKQLGDSAVHFAWLVLLVPCAIIAIILSLAFLIIAAGRSLATHRRHTFCIVTACIECLLFPFGTILGVFSLILLTRTGTKLLFATSTSPTATPA